MNQDERIAAVAFAAQLERDTGVSVDGDPIERPTVLLSDLNGAVQYRLAAGGVGEAVIFTRTHFSRPEDMHYPHSYRVACNTAGWTVSFSQASIDRGDVWPHPEPGVSSRILRAYHTARAAGVAR